MSFLPMLQKEVTELWKSYKLLFVPIIFAVLAVSHPISMEILPSVLEGTTNLPEGTVINIPTPPASDVVAATIDQIGLIGMLVLILVSMGAIAGERSSGVAAMVLVKPVGRGRYFTAKMLSYTLLVTVSLLFSMAMAAYYTEVIFGKLEWLHAWLGVLAYLPNLLLVVAVTLCGSAFLRSPVAAGGFGLVSTLVLMNVPNLLREPVKAFSPGELTLQARSIMQGQEAALVQPLTGVLILTVMFLVLGWLLFKRQEI